MQTSIQSKMMRGALWMVLFKFLDRSLGFISTLILVRLLTPADFGIVAMGLSFVFMAEVLSSFGFDIALIQHQNPTDEHYHSAWTCNVILGAVTTVILAALASPVATFYGQPEVFWVLLGLSLGPLFASLENIGIVKFRKDLQFSREFKFRASRRILSFAATLPLAFIFRNHWALVGGILVSKLGGSILSYMAQDFRPRFCLTKAKEMFHFSKWLLVNNVVVFIRERGNDLVVGRLYGPASLGVYNLSYEISNMATLELSASINRALLPSFAKIETGDELRSTYRNTMSVLALVAIPAAAGMLAIAPFLVPVALGDQWLQATGLIEILAFNGVLLLFQSSICSVLVARGFPSQVAKTNGLYVVVLVSMLLAFAGSYGVKGIACAVLGTSIIMVPAFLYQMKKRLGIGPKIFFFAVLRPAIAALFMVLAVRALLPVYDPASSMLVTVGILGAGVSFGAAVYVISAYLLWRIAGRPRSAESMILDRVNERLRSRREKVAIDKTANNQKKE